MFSAFCWKQIHTRLGNHDWRAADLLEAEALHKAAFANASADDPLNSLASNRARRRAAPAGQMTINVAPALTCS